MKKTAIVVTTVTSLSCTVDVGQQTKESERGATKCVNIRDGETFIFNNDTAHNIRIKDGADSSMDITDSTGKVRHLCSSMEDYLKCETVQEGIQ